MRTGIVAFLTGNMALLYWPYFPRLHIIFIIFVIGLILCVLLYRYRTYYSLINKIIFPASVMGLCFLGGFLWTTLYIDRVVAQLDLKHIEGQSIRVNGQIVSLPAKDNRKTQFIFAIHSRETGNADKLVQDHDFSGRVRLSWYGSYQKLQAGQYWQLEVRLKHNNGLMNPGGFDYEQWLFQNHIQATGYVRNGRRIASEKSENSLLKLRQSLANSLDSVLQNNPYKGLFKALAIGSRADISSEQWQLLRHTGTNHLIAISGLHIGLLAALSGSLVFFFWRRITFLNSRLPALMAASMAALVAAVIYAVLAGFAIPTQRALLMLVVVFIMVLSRRTFYPSYVLLWALFIVLLIDPLSSLSAGFWLSFAAVAVIVMSVSSRLSLAYTVRYRPVAKIAGFVRIQGIVFFGLLPLTAILFHQFSVVAPVANLLAIPVMSVLIVPVTLAATVLSLFHEASAVMIFNWLVYPLDALFWFLKYLDNSSFSVFYLPGFSKPVGLMIIVASLWLLMPRGWPGRLSGILLFLPVFFIAVDRPESGTVHLTMLDVGQGLAMVVQTRTHSLVFDTGDKYSEKFNMADSVIIPFLKYRGISSVDRLIISHTDSDHSGSLAPLYQGFSIKSIMSGEADSAIFKDYPVEACHRGQQWNWDGVHFKILSPLAKAADQQENKNNNNRSCVLQIISADNIRYLLTGDIEKKIERQLLINYPDLKANVLQIPHHGSNTSSTSKFIKQLEPTIALFSYGYRNRFHHPSSKVVQRYRRKSVKIVATVNGAIDIRRNMSNNSLSVIQYRQEKQRFWHRKTVNW